MKSKNIKIVLSILLFLCLLNLPYGFYDFVRFAAVIGFSYLAFSLNTKKNKNEVFLYIGLAILFQPFIKIALGSTESTSWQCNEYSGTFSRSEFDQSCMALFDRSMSPVLQALDNANVRINEVDELVLVGGSSRLLGVRERLKKLFEGRELRTTVDPDLAVALGAAASRV